MPVHWAFTEEKLHKWRSCIHTKARQTEFAVYRHRPHGFSDFPKIFRFQIQYSKYAGLGRTLSSALISGRGSGDLELEHVAILVSLIVWNLNNDRPPACKIENFVTINCEFSLSRLITIMMDQTVMQHSCLVCSWHVSFKFTPIKFRHCPDI